MIGERGGEQLGFTLVEILVAMTMLGVLSLALFGGLRFGMRAWDRIEEHAVGMDEMRAAQKLLRRSLEQAYPLYITGDRDFPNVDFEGTSDALVFLAPAPKVLANGGYARFSIRMKNYDQGKSLIITATSKPVFPGAPAYSQEETLLGNISSVKFSYFGKAQPTDVPRWHDRWQGQPILPQLVRIHIEFPGGDNRYWPELIVSPYIYTDTNCVFDQLTKYCQGR